MARIVLGIGASHAPIINATREEWVAMMPREREMQMLDREGRPATYDELVAQAAGRYDQELSEEILTRRYDEVQSSLDRLATTIETAGLDSLIVIGDDQRELFLDDNLPGMLLYTGASIKNSARPPRKEWVEWFAKVHKRYYTHGEPQKEFRVDQALSLHMMHDLVEDGFDLSISRHLPRGEGEGHAIAFVHQRLYRFDDLVPIVPFFINTYFPPNQPTPRRCFELGQAIARAVASYPKDARIGIMASGGLSHFSIDAELDRQAIDAVSAHDVEAIAAIPRNKLNSGNSEIRNWFVMSGATAHLKRVSLDYIPTYRSPAGTGTGMCFAAWA